MWIDIHVQTDKTVGGLGLEDVATAARESGLDGLAVTDIGTMPDRAEMERISSATGVRLFSGIKLPTEAGVWLAYPPREDEGEDLTFHTEDSGLYPLSAVETLARNGWALVLSQPFGEGGPGEAVYSMRGLHGLEVTNSSSGLCAKDLSLEAALALRLSVMGGSGVLGDLSVLGRVGTAFMPSISSQRDFHGALVSGAVMLAEKGRRDIQEVEEKPSRKRKPRRRKPRTAE
jgi:hypothetical protein